MPQNRRSAADSLRGILPIATPEATCRFGQSKLVGLHGFRILQEVCFETPNGELTLMKLMDTDSKQESGQFG